AESRASNRTCKTSGAVYPGRRRSPRTLRDLPDAGRRTALDSIQNGQLAGMAKAVAVPRFRGQGIWEAPSQTDPLFSIHSMDRDRTVKRNSPNCRASRHADRVVQ